MQWALPERILRLRVITASGHDDILSRRPGDPAQACLGSLDPEAGHMHNTRNVYVNVV